MILVCYCLLHLVSFNLDGLKTVMAMAFAVEEINRNPDLLPAVKLGYRIFDNCMRLDVAFRAAMALVTGTNKYSSMHNCSGLPPVLGIVGDPMSSSSIAISSVMGLFRVPMVCHSKQMHDCEHCLKEICTVCTLGFSQFTSLGCK